MSISPRSAGIALGVDQRQTGSCVESSKPKRRFANIHPGGHGSKASLARVSSTIRNERA